jgi:LacI family transcriptional regulator
LENFQTWLQENRPDVILGGSTWLPSFLTKMKLKTPQDIGFVNLTRNPQYPAHSGIDQCLDEVGAAAIDLLGAMLHQNEYGLPKTPKIIVLEGRWVEGKTVRAAT